MQSPERLRLLLILTVVDIRAVGPGVWNEWKRALLRTLFEAAEERLRLGHKQRGRSELVEASPGRSWPTALGWKRQRRAGLRQAACPTAIGWPSRPTGRSPTRARSPRPRRISAMPCRASSPRTMRTAARPGSASSRPTARACSTASAPASPRAGANIIDARIHTTRDGMALDNLLVQDGAGPRLCRPAAARAGSIRSVEKCAGLATRRRRCRSAPQPRPQQPRSASRRPSRSPSARRTGRRWSRSMRATGRRCSPALAARDPRLRPHRPFGAYRHLWRARGRRLLSDPRRRPEAGRRRRRAAALGAARCRPRNRRGCRRIRKGPRRFRRGPPCST